MLAWPARPLSARAAAGMGSPAVVSLRELDFLVAATACASGLLFCPSESWTLGTGGALLALCLFIFKK